MEFIIDVAHDPRGVLCLQLITHEVDCIEKCAIVKSASVLASDDVKSILIR